MERIFAMDELEHLPFVSVIMPVRNEGAFIERSLNAVLAQTYPSNKLEIIVADGNSTDGTRDVVQAMAGRTRIPVKLVENRKGIAPSGLNRAIEVAAGDIVVRVDGHCEIEADYIHQCVKLLSTGRADGVGGPIETIGEGLVASSIAMAMSSSFGVGGSAFRTVNDRELYTDTVAFPGYTREVLQKAGPFDEELVRNQDDEYNYRIRELGGRILLSPRIRSRYYSRSTFKSLWGQYFQYGYWKVRVFQLHPKQMRLRQFVPLFFVMGILLLSVLSTLLQTAIWMLLALLGAYALCNIAAGIYTAKVHPLRVPAVCLAFLILHLSYGSGSLAGLIALRDGWRRFEKA